MGAGSHANVVISVGQGAGDSGGMAAVFDFLGQAWFCSLAFTSLDLRLTSDGAC